MPKWGQSQLLPISHGSRLRCLVLLRASSQACAREAERHQSTQGRQTMGAPKEGAWPPWGVAKDCGTQQ